MVKCTTLTTSAGNLIGNNQNSITAGGPWRLNLVGESYEDDW